MTAGSASGRTPDSDCPMADLPSWAEAHAASVRAERRDAADNRRRILDAARALFAARPIDAVTMQEIGREAAVGQGTLYRRYPHKGALCEALLGDSTYDLYQAVADDVEAGPPLTRLERLLERVIAFNEANAALLGVACGERPGAWFESPVYVWLHGTVAALLRQAEATGGVAPLDIEATADALLAPLEIELYRFQRERRGFTPERIAAGVRRIVAGLRADRPTTATEGSEPRAAADRRA